MKNESDGERGEKEAEKEGRGGRGAGEQRMREKKRKRVLDRMRDEGLNRQNTDS